jgi:UDP-N-acetylglucosamine--N-acetylmuramyl-(pentapeptide) pyrophosphoryl-undecaprenol N-acetylglucosamine transferase
MYPATEFLFFGTSGKIEATIVPQRGFPFRSIWVSGFRRSLHPANLLFPLKLVVSLVQSWLALRAFHPDVVVGTGGYVCGPVLYAATLLGIPTVIHESNSYPGITTRFLAARVDRVLSGFERTLSYLPVVRRGETVGTPVRPLKRGISKSVARKSLGLGEDGFVVLVIGGSQGAASVNAVIGSNIDHLRKENIRLVWQTGRSHEMELMNRHEGSGVGVIRGFLDDMESAYAAADLVVSRAGASALAEITVMGKPAILVPYPFAAEDHQTMNAVSMVEAGAAVLVPDSHAGERLIREIIGLKYDPKRLTDMKHASETLARPDAAATIAGKVIELVPGL